jgi:Fe-S cluster assembly ATPase SufC
MPAVQETVDQVRRIDVDQHATMTFLRTALNAPRKRRGEVELSTPQFIKKAHEAAGKLGIDQDMLRRAINVGFSGSGKKRNEILQMALFEPRLRCSTAGRRRLTCTTRAPRWIFWRRRS